MLAQRLINKRMYRCFSSNRSLSQRSIDFIKKEAKKVARGCKLLYNDGKFLIKKKYSISFNDQQYSVKEKKAMARTTTDLLKMIPFSIFIIIPGLELLLPPVLYIFPNMIPSTFVSKKKQENILNAMAEKRPLYADKLHRFLLEKSKGVAEYEQFIEKLKNSPHSITRKDLIDNYDLFVNNIKLSTMDADTLRTVCRFMCLEPWTGFKTLNKLVTTPISKLLSYLKINISPEWEPQKFPFYTIKRNLLMYQLRDLMKNRRAEDMFLLEENLDTIDPDLLVTCCRERAIETQFTTDKKMRKELSEWIIHSTHPLKRGRLRNEVLIFGQIFEFLQDRIDVEIEDEKEETPVKPQDLLDESMERILHYQKEEVVGIVEEVEHIDTEKLNDEQREQLKEKLEEILDEKLLFEQEEKVEEQLKKIKGNK